MLDSLKQTKCIFGNSIESLIATTAMPKFYLPNTTVIKNKEEVLHNSVAIKSRSYITHTDIFFWNNFLKLFGPKEIIKIDPYLEKVTMYIRSHNKIVGLGYDSFSKNIDGIIRKNFFSFEKNTIDSILSLSDDLINTEFFDLSKAIAENYFYEDKSFFDNFDRWLKKTNPVVNSFKMMIEDVLHFLKTKDGIKLWRQLPSLYFAEFEYTPTFRGVGQFLFNFIQPLYYLDESRLMVDLSNYLRKADVLFEDSSEIKVATEGNKIIHVSIPNVDPIRRDFYWEIPRLKLEANSQTLCNWSWINTQKMDLSNPKNGKIIVYDFHGFLLDKHYFSGIGFFANNELEFSYFQKFIHLMDRQLLIKIPNHFMKLLKYDSFWTDIVNLSGCKNLSLDSFKFNEVYSNFHYLEYMKGKNHSWKEASSPSTLNYRTLRFEQNQRSYWMSYLKMLTKTLWNEFYKTSF